MAQTGAPLTSDNVGWKLLEKAGWRKGHGIGAQEQGPKEPIQPSAIPKGQAGLGFQLKTKTMPSIESQLKPLKKKPVDKKLELNKEEEERKEIARFMYSSFKEEPGEVDKSSQATNPLLRSKKSRLSVTNPLL